MADARRVFDWEAQCACALDPETAKAIRDSRSRKMTTAIPAVCAENSVQSEV